MRLRRRILNTLWGGSGARTRVDSLADFPVAQFIQFDLDTGAVVTAALRITPRGGHPVVTGHHFKHRAVRGRFR